MPGLLDRYDDTPMSWPPRQSNRGGRSPRWGGASRGHAVQRRRHRMWIGEHFWFVAHKSSPGNRSDPHARHASRPGPARSPNPSILFDFGGFSDRRFAVSL